MKVQASHPMFPDATHDEQSRQNFVRTMRLQLMGEWQPETAALYRTKVLPAFERANGRPPKNRAEVRKSDERRGLHQHLGRSSAGRRRRCCTTRWARRSNANTMR